jgi:hypothetical protein
MTATDVVKATTPGDGRAILTALLMPTSESSRHSYAARNAMALRRPKLLRTYRANQAVDSSSDMRPPAKMKPTRHCPRLPDRLSAS